MATVLSTDFSGSADFITIALLTFDFIGPDLPAVTAPPYVPGPETTAGPGWPGYTPGAALPPVTSFVPESDVFGLDFSLSPDMDSSLSLRGGDAVLKEALARRLMTPRG